MSQFAPPFMIDSVGALAGALSIASFVPQIVKIWREKSAEGVSLRMFLVTASAFALWTTFGALQGSWPLILSNGACLVLVCVILALRLRFGG